MSAGVKVAGSMLVLNVSRTLLTGPETVPLIDVAVMRGGGTV